jgi:hypothetical protein
MVKPEKASLLGAKSKASRPCRVKKIEEKLMIFGLFSLELENNTKKTL